MEASDSLKRNLRKEPAISYVIKGKEKDSDWLAVRITLHLSLGFLNEAIIKGKEGNHAKEAIEENANNPACLESLRVSEKGLFISNHDLSLESTQVFADFEGFPLVFCTTIGFFRLYYNV